MKKILFLLCGLPGSGKTTWANKIVEYYGNEHLEHCSRDNIRLGMLKPGEEYFAHESQVFNNFIDFIKVCLNYKNFVIVDATHLNEKSRNKVLDKLKLEIEFNDFNIVPVNFIVNKKFVLSAIMVVLVWLAFQKK